jgi:hypothetical protein
MGTKRTNEGGSGREEAQQDQGRDEDGSARHCVVGAVGGDKRNVVPPHAELAQRSYGAFWVSSQYKVYCNQNWV